MRREEWVWGWWPGPGKCPLGLARALVETGGDEEGVACLTRLDGAAAGDWRARWCRGLARLARGLPADALAEFDRVCSDLPGELPPKLALALSAERAGDLETAARLYEVVAATDPGFTSAAFGL